MGIHWTPSPGRPCPYLVVPSTGRSVRCATLRFLPSHIKTYHCLVGLQGLHHTYNEWVATPLHGSLPGHHHERSGRGPRELHKG